MIHLLAPAGLAALLLALPILLLYMLRLRRRDVIVPSTLLWRRALADRRANRPWQKLRHNWLLLLQLLILATLALALARPAVPTPLAAHGQIIVLLDVSASMQAQSDHSSRFELALRALRALADVLAPGDRVAVIAVGPTPQLLLQSGDVATLRRLLTDVGNEGRFPLDGGADWDAAGALAAGLASGADVTTLLVTDAAFDADLPALPGDVRLVPVGDDAANVGIAAFALRRAGDGLSAFVRLRNAGPAASRTLALYADGALVARQTIALPADGEVPLTFPGVPVTAWAEARLEEDDALAVDNRAWVALGDGGSGAALLITSGNRFLAQALRSLPDLTLTEAAPGAQQVFDQPILNPYALVIADGPLTDTLTAANLWLIAPGEGLCGTPGDVITPTQSVRGQWSHALLQYVDWSDVHVARARAYTLPPAADVLLETASGPLLWTVEQPGRRVACLAFNLHDSDLPLRLAFPILTANLAGWLLPQTSTDPLLALPAGQPWTPSLPPAATSAAIVAPDGARQSLDIAAPQVAFTRAGLYRLEAQTPAGPVNRTFALALRAEAESDLRPRPIRVAGSILPPAADAAGWRDVSRWPLLLALSLVMLEAFLWWKPGRSWLTHCFDLLKRHKKFSVLSPQSSVLSPQSSVLSPPVLIRALLLLLLLLSILGFRWTRRTRDLAVVFLLDRSASTRAAWEAQTAFVAESLARKADRDRAALVVFGGNAWVDRPLSPEAELATIATAPRADATDLAEAVRLGLALIPDGAPGRLVLLTDGLETAGDAATALREAAARDVELLVVQTGDGTPGPEVWLADLRLPNRVYPGDRVPVAVTVGANTPQLVKLHWAEGGQSGEGTLDMRSDSGALAFSITAADAGFLPLRVCLEAERDTFSQNNCADGWLMVEGAPQVLVVGETTERAALVAALRQAGLTIVEAMPSELPLGAGGLADYAGIVLVNTPARAFAPQTLAALHTFVRDLGGGLLAVGGPESYGVGGWLGTPLEDALPVEMRVQDPSRFPPLAMVVVIDKSGSMSVEEGGVTKIRLAAEAAIRVAETLNDADTLAVVAFDDRPADTLGPVTMAQRGAIIPRLRRLQAGGGGIYVRESLTYARGLFDQAQLSPETQRHILLLADGSDAEHQEGVLSLVDGFREQQITLSAVSIGAGGDVPFLTETANRGNGRFYLTQRAADLPAIFAEEAARAKRSYIVEETFYPTPVSSWAPVADLAATPPLAGYVAATPKGAAQVVWQATREDPLLAVWQYGLGQAVAWTSDASGRWASGWVSWDEFSRFWGSIVRRILPAPTDAGLALRVTAEGETARVTLDVGASEEGRGYADGLSLALHVAQPGDEAEPQTVPLHQTAPGRYEGEFTPPERRSALLLRLYGDRTLTTGWAAPASDEYQPGNAAAALERLTAVSAARLTDDPAEAFAHTLRGQDTGQPLAPLLTLLAVLLWPVDIAWRRLALTRADVAKLWAALRARMPRAQAPAAAPAVPPTLAATLRDRQRPPAPPETRPETPPATVILPPPPTPPATPPSSKPESAPTAAAPDSDTLAARLKRRIRD